MNIFLYLQYFYHTLKHFDPEAVQSAWQVVESTQPRGLATAQEMGAQVNMEKRPQERVQVASPGHRGSCTGHLAV